MPSCLVLLLPGDCWSRRVSRRLPSYMGLKQRPLQPALLQLQHLQHRCQESLPLRQLQLS